MGILNPDPQVRATCDEHFGETPTPEEFIARLAQILVERHS